MSWPPSISDGLTLPCALCNFLPKFDYHFTEECWQSVVGSAEYRRGVVCLPCFDRMATDKGIDMSEALVEIQFTGIGKTIILKPLWTHHYKFHPGGKGVIHVAEKN